MIAIKKLKNLYTKLKEPTRTCKVCFKDIKNSNLHSFLHQNTSICRDCMKKFNPKFIRFNVGKYKGISIYEYDSTMKQFIYQLKGCFDIELAPIFLEPFKQIYHAEYLGYLIVPIPSYQIDDEIREFNHVEKIFSELNLPIKKVLVKTEKYKQSDHKASERKQICNYLKLSDLESVKNKRILLVDDIFTTGSTLSAAISLLGQAHPKDIKILVIAKTIFNDNVMDNNAKSIGNYNAK